MTNNFYHRYLDLPFNYPKPEKFNYSVDNYAVMLENEKIYEPFQAWIESFGLTISNVLEAFYTKPNGGKVPLHADTGHQKPGVNDICKLNFTWGPLDSTTRWYQIKDESKLIKHHFGTGASNKKFYEAGIEPDIDISYVWLAEWDDVDLVYEAVIDRPSLLNISQLHSTWNPSPDEGRWTLCFTLLENGKTLSFQRATEIFKEHIVEQQQEFK
jgi:hypothetical protein